MKITKLLSLANSGRQVASRPAVIAGSLPLSSFLTAVATLSTGSERDGFPSARSLTRGEPEFLHV